MRAFSPSSVTLFFHIVDSSPDPLKVGSRGVGVCLSLGALTQVVEGYRIEVIVNGERVEGSIQEDVAREMGFRGRVETRLHLPVSQGFGMSASAALSTALAIGAQKGILRSEAVSVAHRVEVRRRSGLGDVASQAQGGFTVRTREGIPPYGVVDALLIPPMDVTLVIFGEEIETAKILREEENRERINRAGKEAMEKFLKELTLKRAVELGREFSRETGLASDELLEFMARCPNSTMAMIGNSAIVFGECPGDVLEGYRIIRASIGERAKVLD